MASMTTLRETLTEAFQGSTLSSEDQAAVLQKIEAAVGEGRMRPEDIEKVIKTMRVLGGLSPQMADALAEELARSAQAAPLGNKPLEPATAGWRQVVFWLIAAGIAVFLWTLLRTT